MEKLQSSNFSKLFSKEEGDEEMFQAPTPRVKESYLKPIKSGNHFLSEISLDVQVPPFLKD